MQPRYQRSLQAKLQENAPMYGLSEVTFRSFMLKRGWSRVGSELTAADTVAAVTALLEADGRPDDPDNTHAAKFWCAAAPRPAKGTPWAVRSSDGDRRKLGSKASLLHCLRGLLCRKLLCKVSYCTGRCSSPAADHSLASRNTAI